MMLRAWTAVLVLMPLAACAPQTGVQLPGAPGGQPHGGDLRIQLLEGAKPQIRRIPLERYVEGAVASELTPGAGDDVAQARRMFELQALLVRTFAVASRGRHRLDGFDLCATTHCQLYQPERLERSRWTGAVREAVRRTAGQVVWHGTRAAQTLYHADCGGHTSAPADVWAAGAMLPYLRAARDAGPASRAHSSWQYEIDDARMLRALNADARTRVGHRLSAIHVHTRDQAGRAQRVTLSGETNVDVQGEVLREVLSRAWGARSIRSTLFEVRRAPGGWQFTGRGFGHGVGLCQAGAYARIRSGARPAETLAVYYPGTRVHRLP